MVVLTLIAHQIEGRRSPRVGSFPHCPRNCMPPSQRHKEFASCDRLLSRYPHDMSTSRNIGSLVPPAPADSAHVARGNKQETRLAAILSMLQQSGSVSVEDLRNRLEVSVVT